MRLALLISVEFWCFIAAALFASTAWVGISFIVLLVTLVIVCADIDADDEDPALNEK